MGCDYCDLAQDKNAILHSDDSLVVAMPRKGANVGHILVFPKDHTPILETVDDAILQKCSIMANKVSIAVFEGFGATGTNILIRNGLGAGQSVPHFAIEVIARKENDGLDLQWNPLKLEDVDMEQVLKILKEQLEKKVIIEPASKQDKEEQEMDENYLLKSLKRIP